MKLLKKEKLQKKSNQKRARQSHEKFLRKKLSCKDWMRCTKSMTKSMTKLYAMLEEQKRMNEEIISRHFVRADMVNDTPTQIPDRQSQRVPSKIVMGCKALERYKKAGSIGKRSYTCLGRYTCAILETDHPRESNGIHLNNRNPLQASGLTEVCFDSQQKNITCKKAFEKNTYFIGSDQKKYDAVRTRMGLSKTGLHESLGRNERSKTWPRYRSFNDESSDQQNESGCTAFGYIDVAQLLRASLKASNDKIGNGSASLPDSSLEFKSLAEEPVKNMELWFSRIRPVRNYLTDKLHSEVAIEKDLDLNIKTEVEQDVVQEDRHVTKTQTWQLGSADSVEKMLHKFLAKKKSPAHNSPFFGVHYNIVGCKEVTETSSKNSLMISFDLSDDKIKSGNDFASMYFQMNVERLKSTAINNAIALYNGSELITKHRANPIAMVNSLHCCIPSLFLVCRDALIPFVALYEVKPPWYRPLNSIYSATLARIDTTAKIETPNMSKIPVTTWKVANKIYTNQLLTTTLDITLFRVKQIGGILSSSPLNTTCNLSEQSFESVSNILSGINEKAVHQREGDIVVLDEMKEISKNNGCMASCLTGSTLTAELQHGNGIVILTVPSLRLICMKMFFYSVKYDEYEKECHQVPIKLTQLGLLYRDLASKNVQLSRHKARANDTSIIPLRKLCVQLFVDNTFAILAEEDGNSTDSRDGHDNFDDDVKAPGPDHLVCAIEATTEFACVPLPEIGIRITLRDLMDSNRISYQFTEAHAQFLCINLLRCLKNLHSQDKIHGAISPRNVMFELTGDPYLVGFENSQATEVDFLEMKQIPLIEYVTPEYITSGQISDATDVFQIGALVYHLLYGKLPHQGSTDQESRENLLNENFKPEFKPCALTKNGRYFIRKCLRWFQTFDSEVLANQAFPSPFKDLIEQSLNDAKM